MQYFCADLNNLSSAEDQLSEIQKEHPKYFSSDVISTKQVLRLLEKVIERGGGKSSPTASSAKSAKDLPSKPEASKSSSKAAAPESASDNLEVSADFDDSFSDSFDGSEGNILLRFSAFLYVLPDETKYPCSP